MAFHNRLKQARENKGLTQAQVANLLGIAKSTYSGYETGKSEPSMHTIASLIKELCIKPEFLWQDEVEESFRNEHPEILHQRDDSNLHSADEQELLRMYRDLIPSAKDAVLTTVRAFYGNQDMRKDGQEVLAI